MALKAKNTGIFANNNPVFGKRYPLCSIYSENLQINTIYQLGMGFTSY
jgi:hypothetical protein